jgi:membrane-associated protein
MEIIELLRLAAGIMFTPISDEVILLSSLGIWAADGVNPYGVWLASWGMVFVAFLWFYVVGMFFRSIPLFNKWMSTKWLNKAEKMLSRYGFWAVMVSFFVPGVRHPIHYVAGIMRMPLRKYVTATLLASSIYTGVWTGLVYTFDEKVGVEFVLGLLLDHLPLVAAVVLIVVLTLLVCRRRKALKVEEVIEKTPGC